jgi:hypothetical protein
MGTRTTGRGYVPIAGHHSLLVEIAPGMAIHRVVDLALKSVASMEVGLLYVERRFGILETHGESVAEVEEAGAAILAGLKAKAAHQMKPETLFTDIVEDVTDQHAVIINRRRAGSLITPGENLLVYEMRPALFSLLAANEAEKAVPDINLVNISEIGAAGRVYLSGAMEHVTVARDVIETVLSEIEGRES